jgi:hypothetical protein
MSSRIAERVPQTPSMAVWVLIELGLTAIRPTFLSRKIIQNHLNSLRFRIQSP